MKNNTDESKTEILKMKLRIQKNKVKEVIRSAKKSTLQTILPNIAIMPKKYGRVLIS